MRSEPSPEPAVHRGTRPRLELLALLLALLPPACRASSPAAPPSEGPPVPGARLEGARAGWQAELVLETAPAGIWTVQALPFLARYGTPEVVALDDRGRCHVLIPYSGRWTALTGPEDGRWLGALACVDLDPRLPGPELYVGGQSGNLYQVVVHRDGPLEQRRIARFAGEELHTLVAGELDPRVPGAVLLAFTGSGTAHRLRPGSQDGAFQVDVLIDLPGRVRDALVLEEGPGGSRIALASRDGTLSILRIEAQGPRLEVLHAEPMGVGRIARAPARPDSGTVLYSTRDDGRVLRHAEGPDGVFETTTIHVGPQGPRGLATGPFHDDPDLESVAVFGYSAEAVMLTREGELWRAETIFVDRDKGHWLSSAELDGRNGTRELLASGFGGRVVLLRRPPGYALPLGPALTP